MRRALALLLGLLGVGNVTSCLCLPSGGGGGSTADAGAESDSASAGAPGKLSLAELEARAKQARWKIKRSAEDREGVYIDMDLELESDDHFAYVTYFDYSPARAKPWRHVMVKDVAVLLVEVHDEEDKSLAAAIAKTIAASVDIEEASRESLGKVIEASGHDITATSADHEDGLRWITADGVTKDETSFSVMLHDYAGVAAEGRLAHDELHWLAVHVCQDCTEQEDGFRGRGNHAAAKRLLAQLAGGK